MTVLPIHPDAPERLVGGGCFQEKMINGCGPYLYHVTKHHGKQTWRYCGKVGSARAQAARAAIYLPDDGTILDRVDESSSSEFRVGKSNENIKSRVGKTQVSDGNSRPIVKRRG